MDHMDHMDRTQMQSIRVSSVSCTQRVECAVIYAVLAVAACASPGPWGRACALLLLLCHACRDAMFGFPPFGSRSNADFVWPRWTELVAIAAGAAMAFEAGPRMHLSAAVGAIIVCGHLRVLASGPGANNYYRFSRVLIS